MSRFPAYTLAFALLFTAILSGSCSRSFENLVYKDVRDIQLLELSLEPEIGMDVQFYNPNPYPLSLKEAELNLYFNDQFVGTGKLQRSHLIPARDSFFLPVRLQSNLEGLFSQAYQLLSNQELEVEVKGHVKAGRGVTLQIPIHYQGRQHLNIKGF